MVSAHLGVMMRSIAGSSARLRNRVHLSSAPVRSKSLRKYCASSAVIPMAANMTANCSSLPRTFACLAICAAMRLCGSPAPLNSGSFCPRTRLFIPSMVDIPVWMNSLGYCLASGFIGEPFMSHMSSGMIGGPPSMGVPEPSSILPRMSVVTGILSVSPVNLTVVFLVSSPVVPSNTCTMALPFPISRTVPFLFSPSGVSMLTSSLNPTPSTFWTMSRGPVTSVTVL